MSVRMEYGHLVRQHAAALTKGDEDERKRIYELIEQMREQHPRETLAWDDYYDSLRRR